MKKLRGFTLIELLIVVAIIAILAAIAVPNFLEAQTRAKVSRAQSDMRSIATALEAYFIDNNAYPAMTTNPNFSHDFTLYRTVPANVGRTFRRREQPTVVGQRTAASLTSPVSFITSLPADPFGEPRGVGFFYFTDGPGWILSSLGPNGQDDIGFRDGIASNANGTMPPTPATRRPGIETTYDSRQSQPSPLLLAGTGSVPTFSNPTNPSGDRANTYDPTNGTTSTGNVWRVKQ